MNIKIYKKINFISNLIPIKAFINLTSNKLILPYYHSVTNHPKPHIKNLGYFRTKTEFINDINYLLKYYESISCNELINTIDKPSFHLTFDDGLSEIIEEVVPILIEKNIHATFFINTDFLDNKTLFYRHKIGVIIESLKEENYLSIVANYLKIKRYEVTSYLLSLNQHDTALIDLIANMLNINFEEYLEKHKPYLTNNQVHELIKLGFTIGNHGKSHFNFNTLTFAEQQNQISETNLILRNTFNIKKIYFSFPFGDENIKKEFFEFIYDKEDILLSFGVAGLKKDTIKQHLYRIPMEHLGYSAKNIIKYEYFYYILKSFINKNYIQRND